MTLFVASEPFLTEEQVRAADNCGCVTNDSPTDEILEAIIDHASDLIVIMTGYRVTGRRQLLARPCRTGMSPACCDCCGLDGIPLGDRRPVVDRVRVNGVTLTSNQYELHSTLLGYSLVRTSADGLTRPLSWPSVQQRWRADNQEDTFSILFTEGISVDVKTIQDAVMELVCDMVSTDITSINELPSGVTTAQLGGTTITVDPDRMARAAAGELGPAFVKMLGIYAPAGRQTSTVWAPELLEAWDLNLAIVP